MNSQHDRSIITSVQKMAGTFGKQLLFVAVGEVVSVDKGARTCTVAILTNETEVNLEGVKLQTMVGDGILLIPSIGSNVTLIYATKQDAVIVQCSDLDSIEFLGGNSGTATFVKDSITFFGGSLGGLVLVNELTTKLNAIENDLDNLKTLLLTAVNAMAAAAAPPNAALPVLNSVLSSYFQPFQSYASQIIVPTQVSEIENPKIKQ
jgi:hypothetical protein